MKRSNSLIRRNTAHADGAEESSTNLSLTTPLRADRSDEGTETPTMAGKRKKPEYQPGRFKAVSQLVMAMNRFKARSASDEATSVTNTWPELRKRTATSLNPTYTFGKRTDSGALSTDSPESSGQDFSSAPLDTSEGTPPIRRAYSTRGNKTNYLLKALPPVAGEVKAA